MHQKSLLYNIFWHFFPKIAQKEKTFSAFFLFDILNLRNFGG